MHRYKIKKTNMSVCVYIYYIYKYIYIYIYIIRKDLVYASPTAPAMFPSLWGGRGEEEVLRAADNPFGRT